MDNPKNYQILDLVAKGGTAVLYKAIQTSLERTVAVKKLHLHLTEDENFTRRFILEAKAAASLDHDNIVKIIDFGNEDESYYMVMEFIEGESLRDIIDRWKQIPVEIALSLCYSVLLGLEHAHAKGIVHRDIKPGNIMITRGGRVKITDFGLAKLTQSTTQHTAANSILGTPLYMSPEQAYGESVDQRSDLFSLGTMLYELITGVQPFRDENYMGVIQNILKRNAPHPSRFDVDVPPPVQSILSKAMNKSREARFQSAKAFRAAIEEFLGLAELKDATESVRHLLNTDGDTVMLPRTIRSQKRKSRLRRGFVAAIAVVTLFGAAGIGYTLAPQQMHYQVSQLMSLVDRGDKEPWRQEAGSEIPGAYLDALMSDSTRVDQDRVNVAQRPDGDQRLSGTGRPTVQSASGGTGTALPLPDPVHKPAPTPPAQTTAQQRTSPPRTTTQADAEKPPPKPVARKGWLKVEADPVAEVYVDGTYRGETPTSIELTTGMHKLECRHPQRRTYSERVRVISGELSRRSIVMEQIVGFVKINTTDGAQILVDGKRVGVTPLSKPLELSVGEHQLTIKKSGFNEWNNTIHVRENETLPLRITLSPSY